jgi:hypothetical protein
MERVSYMTLCGHAENRKGHCAEPGCLNRWQICPDCNPQIAARGDRP